MPDDFNRSATTTDATYSTEQIESAYNVKWICYPILLILGTVGNLLNMLILSGIKSRNSTNVYLAFVATADLVVLWFHLPQYIHDSKESYVSTLSTEAQAKYEVPFRQFEGIQRWGQETAIQLSDWTLLIFSCERLLTSLRPFYFRERCSVNTAIVMECVLLFLCMLFNLYGPVQSYYCLGTPEYASNETVCIQNTEWLANWVPVEERATIVVVIFKFVAMIALNSALACTLYHSWHSTASLKNGAPFHGPEPYVKSNRILGASTLLYLAAQLPSLVMKIIMYSHDHYGGATLSDSTQQFATPFVQMTFLANYALNFYIYFSVSKRFREEVRSIRRRFARKSPRQSPKSSVGDLPLRVMVAGSSQLTLVSQSSVCETLDMVMSPTPTLAPIPEIEIESDVESEQDEKGPPPPRGRSGPRFSIGNIELQR